MQPLNHKQQLSNTTKSTSINDIFLGCHFHGQLALVGRFTFGQIGDDIEHCEEAAHSWAVCLVLPWGGGNPEFLGRVGNCLCRVRHPLWGGVNRNMCACMRVYVHVLLVWLFICLFVEQMSLAEKWNDTSQWTFWKYAHSGQNGSSKCVFDQISKKCSSTFGAECATFSCSWSTPSGVQSKKTANHLESASNPRAGGGVRHNSKQSYASTKNGHISTKTVDFGEKKTTSSIYFLFSTLLNARPERPLAGL